MKKAWYVGIGKENGKYIAFQSIDVPTELLFGELYSAVIGPFSTKRGADFMAKFGRNNPHLQCVRDAERWARIEAQGLAPE
jgi:hypothetical protein